MEGAAALAEHQNVRDILLAVHMAVAGADIGGEPPGLLVTFLARSGDDIGSAVHLAKAEPAALEQARQRRIDRPAAADALALSAFDAVGRKDDLDLSFSATRHQGRGKDAVGNADYIAGTMRPLRGRPPHRPTH